MQPHGKISCPAASRPWNLTYASSRPKQPVYPTPQRQLFGHTVQVYSIQTSGGVTQRMKTEETRRTRGGFKMCYAIATDGSPLSVERRYTPGSLVDVKNRDHKEMVVIPIMMINSTLTPPRSGSVGALYRSHARERDRTRRGTVNGKPRSDSTTHSNTQKVVMGTATRCAVSTGCQAFSAGPIIIQPSRQKRFSDPPSGLCTLSSLLTLLKCCHTLSTHGCNRRVTAKRGRTSGRDGRG